MRYVIDPPALLRFVGALADALIALDADLARAANGLVALADFDDLFRD